MLAAVGQVGGLALVGPGRRDTATGERALARRGGATWATARAGLAGLEHLEVGQAVLTTRRAAEAPHEVFDVEDLHPHSLSAASDSCPTDGPRSVVE